MTQRLPIVGSDKDQWGTILNDFLKQSKHSLAVATRANQYTALAHPNNAAGTAEMVQNRMVTYPFTMFSDATLNEIWINVTVLQASATMRVGIYNGDDGRGLPSSLLAELGTFDCSTTGNKSITGLGVNLLMGNLYWIAYVLQGTSSAPSVSNSKTHALPMFPRTTVNFTGPMWGCLSTTTVTGALPDPFPWAEAAGSGTTLPPVFVCRFA